MITFQSKAILNNYRGFFAIVQLDNKSLAISFKNEIYIKDLKSDQCDVRFKVTENMNCLLLLDDERLASASEDMKIKL